MPLLLADEAATLELGTQLAIHSPAQQATLHLEGELGAGKTTLARGFLHALGHTGNVKSPTYTLVERYQTASRIVYHFDLYRLTDPEELDYLGMDDYFSDNNLCLIEWPQQAGNALPAPDLKLNLHYQQQQRHAIATPITKLGQHWLNNIDLFA